MNTSVEFLMWLAQNNPDCLNLHANDKDFGKKAFTELYNHFLTWRGQDVPLESAILKVMQDADDTLAETDYNTGYLNGMERALALVQHRKPRFISTERLSKPEDAMRLKESILLNKQNSKHQKGNTGIGF
ncbi:MAG TPA: hypothetical protein VGD65_11375 [Chryseosolibacter sp.]